jgi:hypothetical protein
MRTDPSRFDKVEEHPDYPSAPAQPVLPADAGLGVAAVAGPVVISIFGALFLLVAITLLVAIRPPLWFSMIVIASGLAFIAGGVLLGRVLLSQRDAPIERMIAVVVKERTHVTSDERSASTNYYATLQTRDGARAEYRVSRNLVGSLVVDDIGVAYVRERTFDLGFTTIKSRALVEFIRFEVDN